MEKVDVFYESFIIQFKLNNNYDKLTNDILIFESEKTMMNKYID